MKLGIMQPYFFPYLGYFSLIKNTDHFVFFDTPQYERRSWMNRNRILNINGDVNYITVPLVKAPQKTAIKDMIVDNTQDWPESMIAKMGLYKKKAPYYEETVKFFRSVLKEKYHSLADLNVKTTIATCEYLGIEQRFDVFSKMDLSIGPVSQPDEWALEITKAMSYDTYINPPGGTAFFRKELYTKNGIDLKFLKINLQPYIQCIGRFESSLSIIDAMMFNSKETIRNMLDEYELL